MPILHRSWYSVYPKGDKPLSQHPSLISPLESSMQWFLFAQTVLLSPGFHRDQMRLKHSIIQAVLADAKSATNLTRSDQWQLLYSKYFRKRFNDLFDVYASISIHASTPYSISVNGRELNPDQYVLKNKLLRRNIAKLYSQLVTVIKTDAFEFRVTGGDRYRGKDGKAYSSTNNNVVKGSSGPAHIRGDAVDLRIRYNAYDSNSYIPLDILKQAIAKTDLIIDPNALPDSYSDRHYHLQLPKGFKP